MPNHAETLEHIVERYMQSRLVGTPAEREAVANEALGQGLAQLQQLNDALVDGLAHTQPTEVVSTLHTFADIPPSMISATLLAAYLTRLHTVVQKYHLHVMCGVGVLTPPVMLVAGENNAIRVDYTPVSLTQGQQDILTERQLMQQSIGAYVARVTQQLLWLQSLCSLLHTMSGTATNHAVTTPLAHMMLRPANIQDTMITADAQRRCVIENMLLNSLLSGEFRRCSTGGVFSSGIDPKGDQTFVMRPVLTPDGYPTGAYTRHCSLMEYVSTVLTDGSCPVLHTLSAGHTTTLVPQLTQFLAQTMDVRFPTLQFDNHVYAFTNGTYNILTLKFRPYGSETNRILAQTDMSAADDAQHSAFQAIVDQENEALDNMSPADVAARQQTCLMSPRMYIPLPFHEGDPDLHMDDLERECEPLMRIFTYQEFAPEVRHWIYAVLGRMLFTLADIRERGDEEWQTCPYLLGRAGTGKSCIADLMISLFPSGKVGAVEKNFEQVFGFESLAGMDAVVASEFPSGLPTETLQKALCGELISVAGKNKVAQQIMWVAQWLIAANEFWSSNNENAQLTRRMAIIEFTKFVVAQDTRLGALLRGLRPRIIVLLSRWYRHMVQTNQSGCSFASATAKTTDYFVLQRTKMFILSNPLARYLSNAALFRRTPQTGGHNEYYISWTMMLTKLAEYARSTHIKGLSSTHYNDSKHSTMMQMLSLRVEEKTQRYDYVNGEMAEDTWIIGITHRDFENALVASFTH